MTGPDLRIIDQDFSDAILSMGKIENAFSSMGRNFLEYFPITGHLGLSTCMSSFESDWENKRHDLTETLKSYRKQLKQVQDIFTRVDNKIGEKTQPHGTTTQPPGKTTQPPGKTQPSTPPSGQTPSGSTPLPRAVVVEEAASVAAEEAASVAAGLRPCHTPVVR